MRRSTSAPACVRQKNSSGRVRRRAASAASSSMTSPSNELPAARPRGQLARVPEPRQVVQQPGVAHVDLRALRQPFLHVREERLQASHHECPFEYVQVPGDRVRRDANRARQVRHVEQVAVHVREHGPERAQPARRQADTEAWEVALEQRRHVRPEPLHPGPGAAQRVNRGIAAPEPATGPMRRPGEFGREERGQLHRADAAGQRLGDGAHEAGTGRAEQHEPPASACPGRSNGGARETARAAAAPRRSPGSGGSRRGTLRCPPSPRRSRGAVRGRGASSSGGRDGPACSCPTGAARRSARPGRRAGARGAARRRVAARSASLALLHRDFTYASCNIGACNIGALRRRGNRRRQTETSRKVHPALTVAL